MASEYDSGMDEDRSLVAPVIAVMLTAILAAYVVAYFQMGTVSSLVVP